MLTMDPARDAHLVLSFPQDIGLTREQIEERGIVLERKGIAPSYAAFVSSEDSLDSFGR